MFRKHLGTSMLEWVVMAVVAIGVIGTIAYGLAGSGKTAANSAGDAIEGIQPPNFGNVGP